jgi:hypothetical protein
MHFMAVMFIVKSEPRNSAAVQAAMEVSRSEVPLSADL